MTRYNSLEEVNYIIDHVNQFIKMVQYNTIDEVTDHVEQFVKETKRLELFNNGINKPEESYIKKQMLKKVLECNLLGGFAPSFFNIYLTTLDIKIVQAKMLEAQNNIFKR